MIKLVVVVVVGAVILLLFPVWLLEENAGLMNRPGPWKKCPRFFFCWPGRTARHAIGSIYLNVKKQVERLWLKGTLIWIPSPLENSLSKKQRLQTLGSWKRSSKKVQLLAFGCMRAGLCFYGDHKYPNHQPKPPTMSWDHYTSLVRSCDDACAAEQFVGAALNPDQNLSFEIKLVPSF